MRDRNQREEVFFFGVCVCGGGGGDVVMNLSNVNYHAILCMFSTTDRWRVYHVFRGEVSWNGFTGLVSLYVNCDEHSGMSYLIASAHEKRSSGGNLSSMKCSCDSNPY
jgi:hypothetical protein